MCGQPQPTTKSVLLASFGVICQVFARAILSQNEKIHIFLENVAGVFFAFYDP